MSKVRSSNFLTCPKRNVPPLRAAQRHILLLHEPLSTRSRPSNAAHLNLPTTGTANSVRKLEIEKRPWNHGVAMELQWSCKRRFKKVRNVVSASPNCGLLNQSRTRSRRGAAVCYGLHVRSINFVAVWRSRHASIAASSVGDTQSGKCVDAKRRAAGRCGRARARLLRLTLAVL